MKALVGAFNQKKVLIGAFSVIVKTDCENDGSSEALPDTGCGVMTVQRCTVLQWSLELGLGYSCTYSR